MKLRQFLSDNEKGTNMLIIKPPNPLNVFEPNTLVRIFFAGSIEMGKAIEWQEELTTHLSKLITQDKIAILNPRRDDWDVSWEQSIQNPKFLEQVKWELDALEMAEIKIFYFDPNSKSPITLMELGLHARSNPIVYCPNDFWRKGNVDVVAKSYGFSVYENEKDFRIAIEQRIAKFLKAFFMRKEIIASHPALKEMLLNAGK